MGPLTGLGATFVLCPSFGEQKLGFALRKIERFPGVGLGEIDSVDQIGEFAGEANLHLCATGARGVLLSLDRELYTFMSCGRTRCNPN
jgi:hypothetical protein